MNDPRFIYCLALCLLIGCRKTNYLGGAGDEFPTSPSSADIDASTADINAFCKKKLIEIEEDHRRKMFYQAFPSFERLLKPSAEDVYPREVLLVFCCVLALSTDGSSEIDETLAGLVPSDLTDYLPCAAPAGRYLIGSVMPKGGWQYFNRIRPEFCVKLHDDDSFTYGYDGELNGSLEKVREISTRKR